MTASGFRAVVPALLSLVFLPAAINAQTTDPDERSGRIALWGSSVPNGTGDELNLGGYTGRLRQLLEPRGWDVLNVSRGGDNTITITPRFEPEGGAAQVIRFAAGQR